MKVALFIKNGNRSGPACWARILDAVVRTVEPVPFAAASGAFSEEMPALLAAVVEAGVVVGLVTV
jgi:hypothetical protein